MPLASPCRWIRWTPPTSRRCGPTTPGPSRCRARTRGSSGAIRAGSWIPGAGARRPRRRACWPSRRARGGIGGIAVTHDHDDHASRSRPRCAAAPATPPVAGARLAGARRAAGRRRRVRPAAGDRDAGARPRPPRVRRRRRAASPATPCSGAAASSCGPIPARCAATWPRSSGCAGLDLDVICPGHGPLVLDPAAKLAEYLDHRLRPRAAAACTRSTQGCARGGGAARRGVVRRARRRCAARPPSRWPRTSTSWPRRAGCPPAWSAPHVPPFRRS